MEATEKTIEAIEASWARTGSYSNAVANASPIHATPIPEITVTEHTDIITDMAVDDTESTTESVATGLVFSQIDVDIDSTTTDITANISDIDVDDAASITDSTTTDSGTIVADIDVDDARYLTKEYNLGLAVEHRCHVAVRLDNLSADPLGGYEVEVGGGDAHFWLSPHVRRREDAAMERWYNSYSAEEAEEAEGAGDHTDNEAAMSYDGVGRTDGEAIERAWSDFARNLFATGGNVDEGTGLPLDGSDVDYSDLPDLEEVSFECD